MMFFCSLKWQYGTKSNVERGNDQNEGQLATYYCQPIKPDGLPQAKDLYPPNQGFVI